MRALVMAAGLGTRLRPLTDSLPKPLVPLLGRPMIEYVLDQLGQQGFSEAMVNVHYLPEKMQEFVQSWNSRGEALKLFVQDESREILGSGGALALAANWLFERQSTAIVYNSDVIAHPDLRAMISFHSACGAETTLAAMPHVDAGVKYTGLRMAGDKIIGFEKPGIHSPDLFHFPGFYVVEKKIVSKLPTAGSAFSIVDEVWRPLSASGGLFGWRYDGIYLDLGNVADLKAAENYLRTRAQ